MKEGAFSGFPVDRDPAHPALSPSLPIGPGTYENVGPHLFVPTFRKEPEKSHPDTSPEVDKTFMVP